MGEAASRTAVGAVGSGAPPLSVVRRLRHRHIIDRLDYLRGLRRLATRMTQSDLARELGLTQPSISSALKSAAKVADPPVGFSGASVYEIAQRFTAGELGRDDLVDQLSRWPDAPGVDDGSPLGASPRHSSLPDGLLQADSPLDHAPLYELSKALRDGLLDEATYRAVLDQRRRLDRRSLGRPGTTASGE